MNEQEKMFILIKREEAKQMQLHTEPEIALRLEGWIDALTWVLLLEEVNT